MTKLTFLLYSLLCVVLLSCHSKQPDKQVDMDFKFSSKIDIEAYTPEMVDNLAVMGKIWGFLKYYHPVVASGAYNWDFELFRIMPSILKASAKNERNKLLFDWVRSLGQFDKRSRLSSYEGDAKLNPDLDWIEDEEELGDKLSALLKDVRYAERNGKNHYVSLNPGIGNPNFSTENAYVSLPVIDTGYRLLALFRYWNMIQYFYPNRHLVGEDWHAVLKEFIPLFIESKDMDRYKQASLLLIGRIHDTHANLWSDPDIWGAGSMGIPVQMKFVENKLMLIKKSSLYPDIALREGDVILKVNDVPVDSLIAQRAAFYPASNNAAQLRDMAKNILNTNNNSLAVEFDRNGKIIKDNIPCVPWGWKQREELNNTTKKSHSLLADNIGYIYCGTLRNQDIPAIMEEFKDTKGLVLDLRCYPSEFLVFTLTDYLLAEKTDFVRYSIGNIYDPGLFLMTPCNSVEKKNADYYKGKVIILVNEVTQSQAEYTAMAFRVAPDALVIGSITAGADGDVSEIKLPGNLRTMISGIGIYTPDGEETQRVGIIPDIEVRPTIKGIREGKDELLEKAVEVIGR